MGASNGAARYGFLEQEPTQRGSYRAEGGGLNEVVTKGVKQRWVKGARTLAFAQSLIVMEGPAEFVKRCLDSNTVTSDPQGGISGMQEWISFVSKYVMSFIFIIFVPLVMPAIYANAIMTCTWGFSKMGREEIRWSQKHASFKIFMDNDDFVPKNVKLDLVKLRRSLANTSMDMDSQIMYLDRQTFQSTLTFREVELMVALLTLALAAGIFFIRTRLANRRWVQVFTVHILHFRWFNDDLQKLRYTSAELFGGIIKLYKLVPCVWLAMSLAFVIGVPALVGYLNQDKDIIAVLKLASRVMPSAIAAAYVNGHLYMQAANATFTMWLSTGIEFAVFSRQFEVEFEGLYLKLTDNVTYFVVTVKEIEDLTALRSAEMWLRVTALKRAKIFQTGGPAEMLNDAEAFMKSGRWVDAQQILEDVKELGDGHEFSHQVEEEMQHGLISMVYIVDTRADISFWVDVKKGTCEKSVHGARPSAQQLAEGLRFSSMMS